MSRAAVITRYVNALLTRDDSIAASSVLVSSLSVSLHGGHATVRVWSRGAYAGALTIDATDAEELIRLLGCVREPGEPDLKEM
jgi:hypothetical protein